MTGGVYNPARHLQADDPGRDGGFHVVTPLYGLPPGTYDLHFESDGCWWAFSLVAR